MKSTTSRRKMLAALGGVGSMLLAGCSRFSPFSDEGEHITVGENVDTVTVVGSNPSADESTNAPPLSDRQLPLPKSPAAMEDAAQDGGPGKDGIPAVDNPEFVSPSNVSNLADDATVFGVKLDGETKAYRRDILVRHEIVNDTIGGTPVSVTYCPLTGTAQGFYRGETTFGVSGMLVNNNLIMYDRELERWWPQIGAASIPGPWYDTEGGATLQEFEVVWTTFEQWRSTYPETTVLSTDTGFARNYDRDPYESRGYYESDSTLFANIYENDHFHAKRWVYGARAGEDAVAFTRDLVHSDGVVEGELGGSPIVVVHDTRLDTAWMYRNPDEETFSHGGDVIVGEDGTEYPPDELPLERIISFDAYWFAWFAYYPNTLLYE